MERAHRTRYIELQQLEHRHRLKHATFAASLGFRAGGWSLMLQLSGLYYTILYYIILYYTILYSTLLYSTLLYSTLLYSTLLYSTILYYTILQGRLKDPGPSQGPRRLHQRRCCVSKPGRTGSHCLGRLDVEAACPKKGAELRTSNREPQGYSGSMRGMYQAGSLFLLYFRGSLLGPHFSLSP